MGCARIVARRRHAVVPAQCLVTDAWRAGAIVKRRTQTVGAVLPGTPAQAQRPDGISPLYPAHAPPSSAAPDVAGCAGCARRSRPERCLPGTPIMSARSGPAPAPATAPNVFPRPHPAGPPGYATCAAHEGAHPRSIRRPERTDTPLLAAATSCDCPV